MKLAFIAEPEGELEVKIMGRVLGVSVSGYYAWCKRPLSASAPANAALLEHTVKAPVPAGRITAEALRQVNDSFHDLHEHAYTFRLDTPIELVNYHLTAIGLVAKAEIRPVNGRDTGVSRARKETRAVIYEGFGSVNTTVYERDALPLDRTIEGPAIIEEPASVTVVYPDQQFSRDKYGFLHVEMQQPKSRTGLAGLAGRRKNFARG